MNRKGDAAMIMLVLIAFALSVLALLAFVIFDGVLNRQSEELSGIMGLLYSKERYAEIVAKSLLREAIVMGGDIRENIKSLAGRNKDYLRLSGNLYELLADGKFEIVSEAETYQLIVEDVMLTARSGDNFIIRKAKIVVKA